MLINLQTAPAKATFVSSNFGSEVVWSDYICPQPQLTDMRI